MRHKQHAIGSAFTPAATADDVLAGIDLSGRNVVVTGGHAGLGLETTRALARAGASVTVAARNVDRAEAVVAGITHVEVSRLDLLDPESIDVFVTRWLDSGRPLHILINNAGVPAPARLVHDSRGYETQFATNHLGHFQLTVGLLPALRAAGRARVVNVSSGAQRFGEIRWHDPHFAGGDYDPNVAYAQSKVANVLFAVELDRRCAMDGVNAYAVHPGVVVGTALNGATGDEGLRAMGLIDDVGQPVIDPEHGKKTPQQGASTTVFAATSPLLDAVGGVYLKDNDISELDDAPRPMSADEPPSEITSHAIDPDAAERLWKLSERLVGR